MTWHVEQAQDPPQAPRYILAKCYQMHVEYITNLPFLGHWLERYRVDCLLPTRQMYVLALLYR